MLNITYYISKHFKSFNPKKKCYIQWYEKAIKKNIFNKKKEYRQMK